jgi:hypothetical protein
MEIERRRPQDRKPGILKPGKTFIGKLWRGAARGLVDGIPGVGVAVTAIEQAAKGQTVAPTARVISSGVSITVMIWLALERLYGHASFEDVMQVIALILF